MSSGWRDPLAAVERAYLLDRSTSLLRHDVRNKLASIRNMAFYLSKRVGKSALASEDARIELFLRQIDTEVTAADDLFEHFSTFSRTLHVRIKEPVSTGAAIAVAVDSARASTVGVAIAIDAEEATIQIDASEYALAIRCVFENALEAVHLEGTVEIVGRVTPNGYRIEVHDSGQGIAQPDEAFREFFTTKAGHIGLGLNIARNIAKRYGGQLQIATRDEGALVVLQVSP
ncbi:MAG TPA: HAMP domain-containing sensor histidine kinase [Polyangiaceae bacterium]|nr:HAMP domain-containing sensor histidine kinase [Polyangiaceae bacterium]